MGNLKRQHNSGKPAGKTHLSKLASLQMHAAQAVVWFWCLIMANPTMEKFLHARHQQLDSKSNYKNLSPERW
jgi:hypothetical protein